MRHARRTKLGDVSEIIDRVKREPLDGEECFRPDIGLLLDCEIGCDDYVIQCMKDCWTENPECRPDFATIRSRLKRMKDGKYDPELGYPP